MNLELKSMLAFTQHLPRIRGAGWLANKIKSFYNRKSRTNECVSVLGFKMDLEPGECVDGAILFYPQLYDWQELDFVRRNLTPGGRFVDAGANIGWYSLVASRVVGKYGEVLAIEADPYNADKLRRNIDLNRIGNIRVVQAGISDRHEKLKMHINVTGNRGGNSLINPGKEGVEISCIPLLDILDECCWRRIDGMKIDIEGFEYRVLSAFFDQASPHLYPRFLIVEVNPRYENSDNSSLHELILACGYRLAQKTGLNAIYRLVGSDGE